MKIGIATSARQRIRDLQVGCPYPIVLMYKFKVKDTEVSKREKEVHEKLKGWRIRGEWFEENLAIYDLIYEVESGIKPIKLNLPNHLVKKRNLTLDVENYISQIEGEFLNVDIQKALQIVEPNDKSNLRQILHRLKQKGKIKSAEKNGKYITVD